MEKYDRRYGICPTRGQIKETNRSLFVRSVTNVEYKSDINFFIFSIDRGNQLIMNLFLIFCELMESMLNIYLPLSLHFFWANKFDLSNVTLTLQYSKRHSVNHYEWCRDSLRRNFVVIENRCNLVTLKLSYRELQKVSGIKYWKLDDEFEFREKRSNI